MSALMDVIAEELAFSRAKLHELEANLRPLDEYKKINLSVRKQPCGSYYYSSAPQSSIKKYLGNEENEVVGKVKAARLLDVGIKSLKANIKQLERLLANYQPFDPQALCNSLPKNYRSRQPFAVLASPLPPSAKQWKEEMERAKAQHPVAHPESLTQQGADGTMLRSKSEVIISGILDRLNLAYVYELPTTVGDKTLIPDFTIFSESKNKTVVLEHFGLLYSDMDYRQRNLAKLSAYLDAGYILFDDLLITSDDNKGSIDVPAITRMLESCCS